MGEIRIDPATAEWHIVAPERSARPVDTGAAVATGCPFCPGNEHATPPEVLRVPAGVPDWRIRVVPNKFGIPASAGDGHRADGKRGDGHGTPFTGSHEVVIESPRHDWDLRQATPEQATEILFALRERCRALAGGRAAVVAFRNHGAAAGTSLHHPHSQLVALDQAPPGLRNRWQRARDHHARTGRRLLDDLVAAERADGRRVVADLDGVLVYQPEASGFPHETTLVVPDRAAGLADASDRALTALAGVLPATLAALAAVLDDPAYNLVVHAGPAGDPGAAEWFGWHVSLYPRVTTLGGLEVATGLAVNPTAPERTAVAMGEQLAALGGARSGRA